MKNILAEHQKDLREWWFGINEPININAFSPRTVTRLVTMAGANPDSAYYRDINSHMGWVSMELWSIKNPEKVARVNAEEYWRSVREEEDCWSLILRLIEVSPGETSILYVKNLEIHQDSTEATLRRFSKFCHRLREMGVALVCDGKGVWPDGIAKSIGMGVVEITEAEVEAFFNKVNADQKTGVFRRFKTAWLEEKENKALKGGLNGVSREQKKRVAL